MIFLSFWLTSLCIIGSSLSASLGLTQACSFLRLSKLVLGKAEEPEVRSPTSAGSSKKQKSFRKTSALLTTSKPLSVWITTNCGKFLKRGQYQTTWPASWEIYMQVRKQQLELDMEQQAGSKSGKEYIKAVYSHPAYLTYMQSTSCKMPGWMKHKLESRLPGEQQPQIHRWHHIYGRKQRRTKELLDESERGEWKIWLKTKHKIMASGSIT